MTRVTDARPRGEETPAGGGAWLMPTWSMSMTIEMPAMDLWEWMELLSGYDCSAQKAQTAVQTAFDRRND